jgi:DNA mismatch endonuclease (patch repair protein)
VAGRSLKDLPYPYPVSPAVSAAMRGNRRADTKPEVMLRSSLHRRGLRFRKDHPIDLGDRRKPRPDIVFTRKKVAVFIDGCFWHHCPEHGRVPGGRNATYWEAKIARNLARDRWDDESLRSHGWRIVRVWEHEPLDVAVAMIESALGPETRRAK